MECVLCTETCTYYGLTQCGHRSVCSLCWYRLTTVLKKNSCPVCRAECSYIFIVSDLTLSFDSIFQTEWGDSFPGFSKDELSALHFNDQKELNRLLAFRKLICSVCNNEFKQLKQFKEHVSLLHALKMCDQCLQNNKLFPSEQILYKEDDLRIHKLSLHVQCEICYSFHYDQRELLVHIKSQHFFCELCSVEKRTAFSNYEALESHYRKMHYLCEVSVCRETQNIVFMCYDDLKEHYRQEHPTLNVPQPVLGFKIGEDEEDEEESEKYLKNHSAPKINEKNKDFEFPALGPAATEVKSIDYSQIKNKKLPQNTTNNYPALISSPNVNVTVKKEQKKEKKSEKNNKESSELDKNINRMNNGHLTSDEFINWLYTQDLVVDNSFVAMIRGKILSNSDREKVVNALNSYKPVKPKIVNVFQEEEKKIQPKKIENRPISKPESFAKESFPALGIIKKTAPKSISDLVLENIVILNNGLIKCEFFVENTLSFVPREEIDSIKNLIRAKVRPETRVTEVLRILDYKLLITANDNDYPSLAQSKPKIEKSFMEVLRENINHLNSGMMTLQEFCKFCEESVNEENTVEAIKMIKEKIFNNKISNQIVQVIKDKNSAKIDLNDFPKLKMVSLPPEPKKKQNKKK